MVIWVVLVHWLSLLLFLNGGGGLLDRDVYIFYNQELISRLKLRSLCTCILAQQILSQELQYVPRFSL